MNRYGKRCVLYPRVSTEMQVDGYSLEGQKNMLTRFADREEMIIVDTYEDAGKSGKSIEGRPAFQKMLRDIEEIGYREYTGVDYVIDYGNDVIYNGSLHEIYKNSPFEEAIAILKDKFDYVNSVEHF